MVYRILEYGERYFPQYRKWLKWRPMLDYMGTPHRFGTRHGAERCISGFHCFWLDGTQHRRIQWGRTTEPRIK